MANIFNTATGEYHPSAHLPDFVAASPAWCKPFPATATSDGGDLLLINPALPDGAVDWQAVEWDGEGLVVRVPDVTPAPEPSDPSPDDI